MKMMLFNYFHILTIIFVSIEYAQLATVDTSDLLGCYQNDFTEFISNPGYIDLTVMTPSLCIRACSSSGYAYASVQYGQYCMCKGSGTITSLVSVLTNCQNYTCSGDGNFFCGSDSYMLVYTAGALVSSITVTPNAPYPSIANLFSTFTYNVTYLGPANFIYLISDTGAESSYDVNNTNSISIQVTQLIVKTGISAIDFSASSTTSNSVYSKHQAVSSPAIQDNLILVNFTCPAIGVTFDYFFCDITLGAGTHMDIIVDYGDGLPPENFTVLDSEITLYGTPVPSNIAPRKLNPISISGKYYFVSNSEIEFDGILRGIEIYATTSGSITLYLVSMCTGLPCCQQNPTLSCSTSNPHAYTCTGGAAFSSISGGCSNEISNRYSKHASVSLTVQNTFTFNVNAGYNFINQSASTILVKNSFLYVVTGTANLALDTSSALYQDYLITPPTVTLPTIAGPLTPINASLPYARFMIRSVVVRPTTISIYRVYNVPSTYTIKVTLKNNLIPTTPAVANQTVLMVMGIANLTIIAPSGCNVNKPCNLTSRVDAGSNITYYWTMTDVTTNLTTQFMVTTSTSFMYNFPVIGTYLLELVANNNVTVRIATTTIVITEIISGVTFCSGLCNQSASVIGVATQFLFKMDSGRDYTCQIDYGDQTQQSLNYITNQNNTLISHNYPSTEAIYSVVITCINPISSETFAITHYAQYPITGLRLVKKGALRTEPYTIDFSIASGSNPRFIYKFDNVQQGFTFDQNKKIGSSISHGGESSGVHYVYIEATNYVSTQILNDTFEIVAPISGAGLSVTATNISRGVFVFPCTVSFTINLASGSSVLTSVHVGDELDLSIATYTNKGVGDWSAPLTINHVYTYPGDFYVIVNVSNAISSSVLVQNITLMSTVNNLIPDLLSKPVLYLISQGGAIANYKFSFVGTTYSGSHSTVTIWPDTTSTTSYGPFVLGMDFAQNASKTSLFFKYPQIGSYTAKFYLENLISNATYTMTIVIVDGIDGVYLNLVPANVAPLGSFDAEVYIVQGNNVKLEWYLNGAPKAGPVNRIQTSYKLADTARLDTSPYGSICKAFNVTIIAYNANSRVSRTVVLETQYKVLSVVQTLPVNTAALSNKGFTQDRTVTFLITVTQGGFPYYVIDFNDSSPIDFPQLATLNSVINVTHTFPSSGYFYVNVTVFNQVSVDTKIIKVGLLSEFIDFSCEPKWRKFNDDDALEYDYVNLGNSYVVQQEYDLRFHCTWINMDNPCDYFTIVWNGVQYTYTDVTLLKRISNSLRGGYVLPLNSSIVMLGRQTETIGIYAFNGYTNSLPYATTIIRRSAIKDVAFVTNSTITKLNETRTFTVQFASLGEPSCALVFYTTSLKKSSSVTYGTSATDCAAQYPKITFAGVYQKSGNNLILTQKMFYEGLVQVNFQLKNSFEGLNITTSVTVSSAACQTPVVDIVNRASDFFNPTIVQRSKIINLLGQTILNCDQELTNTKQWYMYLVNGTTGVVVKEIQLTSNPTVNNAELVIEENTLNYGTYKFVYQVTMSGAKTTSFTTSIETYVKVVPTGVAVFAFENGVTDITRGKAQYITLEPASYSIDLDGLLSPSELTYYFYCRIVDDGIRYDYPSSAVDEYIDLKSFKSGLYNLTKFNNSCFDFSDDFFFENSDKQLTIKPNTLDFVPDRKYEILIRGQTKYGGIYEQTVRLEIVFFNALPVVTLGCKFRDTCVPFRDYQRINPNTQLMILAKCTSGCDNADYLSYEYRIYKKWEIGSTDEQEKWIPCTTPDFTSTGFCKVDGNNTFGLSTTELTILNDLFKAESTIRMWRIDFTVTVHSKTLGIALGKSSVVIGINQAPFNGTCSVSPTNGTAMSTVFSINCIDWKDTDGYVARYEYYALYKGIETNNSLGYERTGTFQKTLPQGPEFDQYQVKIMVKIIDDGDAATYYAIPTLIQVYPNDTYTNKLINDLLSNNPKSSINKDLFSGNLQQSAQIISNLVASINSQSYSAKMNFLASNNNSNTSSTNFVTTYGPDINVNFSSNFNNLGSIKPSYVGFNQTRVMDNVTFEDERNTRSEAREKLADFASNLSVSDLSSVKLIGSIINTLTLRTDEISREAGSKVTDKCLQLTAAISKFSSKVALEDLKEATASIAACVGSSITGLSTSLNERGNFLPTDNKSALAPPLYYDTDLENFWNNPNNFADGDNFNQSALDANKVVQKQKFQTVDTTDKGEYMVDKLSKVLAEHSNVNQSQSIKTSSLQMTVSRLNPNNISNTIDEGLGRFSLPSFCEMTAGTQTNCTGLESVVVQSKSLAMATSGHNGNNETKIGLSSAISLSFTDKYGKEIPITNSSKPIDVWIPRDPNAPKPTIQYVNVTAEYKPNRVFMPIGFNITTNNASIHLEIYPQNLTLGYVAILKLGQMPRFNATLQDYSYWKMFCPSDLINSTNNAGQKAYLFFLSNKDVGGFKGLSGFGIRELTTTEFTTYCINQTSITSPPNVTTNGTNFTTDYSILLYTSGCYHYDTRNGKWISDGVEVMRDTSIMYTHCTTTHLTTFAGGFIVVPPAINWNHVFANADISKNPTIYATVICLFALYILFGVWARYMDKQDLKKIGVAPLPDNAVGDNYFYEIIVFTGSRKDAGTDSKVRFLISGDGDETDIRSLEDPKRKVFRRGGVDSFIMATKNFLGNLNYIRIWHDNSGKGKWASWYLKYVIIHDLQTKQKYYFICQKWLAVEKEDGLIDRILPVAGEAQKTEFSYLLSKESKKNMSDGHLWFSVFARPAQSAFSRLDRVTCCFVLLFISMLMNIMYYGLDKGTSSGGLEIGPFYLTPEQVGIGIIVNLIVFPPSFLITELFRRSRRRNSKSAQIRDVLQKNIVQAADVKPEVTNKSNQYLTPQELLDIRNQFQSPPPVNNAPDVEMHETKMVEKKKKKKKPLTLPWWCKIVAFILSFIFIGVSAFFVIIKGIDFGDETVKKWLTSLVISFVTSVFLTQPLKVVLVAFFFVLILRKSNDDDEVEEDDDYFKGGRPLNPDEEWLHAYQGSGLIAPKPRSKGYIPLNENEVNEARETRLKEIKMWDILREIIMYSMFLWILYIVSYANMNSYSFGFQNNLKTLFVKGKSNKVDFSSIVRVEEFWDWSINVLAPRLRAGKWYDNATQPYNLAGFISDRTSRMIGYAVIRQNRVKKDSCTINAQLKSQINFCNDDYNFLNEDKANYSYGWDGYNSSYNPDWGMDRVYSAFQYRSAADLNGYPLIGSYNTYWGGGYVYEMRGQMRYLQGNLTLLQSLNWIDRQTRSIIVEFSVYNPNINMFAVCEILLEILPTGSILSTVRIDPISLLNHYQGFTLFALVCDAIYILFVIYYMVNEIRLACKIGKKYLTEFWSIIEWLIIGFSWAAVGMYAYRIYAGNKVLDFFKQTSGYGYFKLQYVAFWNEMLGYCLAFCASLGTLKFLKLLRFNKRMSFLASTIRHSAKELIAFGFMFMIIWCAFVQLMYLFFQDKTIGFSTFIRAMTTCFEIMLGKFEVAPLMKAHSLFGPLLFSLYNIFVVFILINMFVSIINDTFSVVRSDVQKQGDDYEMVTFIKNKIKKWFGIGDNNQVNALEYNPTLDAQKHAYKDQVSYFPDKVDELLYMLAELYVEQRGLNTMYNNEMQIITPKGNDDRASSQMTKGSNETKSTDVEIDKRKLAHRNRSAVGSRNSNDNNNNDTYNNRIPTATGRVPPNRLPALDRNKQS